MIYTLIVYEDHRTDRDGDLIQVDSVSVTLHSDIKSLTENGIDHYFCKMITNHARHEWQKQPYGELIISYKDHLVSSSNEVYLDTTQVAEPITEDGWVQWREEEDNLNSLFAEMKAKAQIKFDAFLEAQMRKRLKEREEAAWAAEKKAELERLAKEEAERKLYQELKLKYEGPWYGVTGEAK